MNTDSLKLNIRQVCQLLNVSQSTIRRWEKEGRIKPSPRLKNSLWRTYTLSDIEALSEKERSK
jgi:DNA-binding transcriptional MerR regulator